MGTWVVKLGIAVGMATAVASFIPLLKLTLGNCFFEQGCGEYENLKLVGVGPASCLAGLAAAYLLVRVARLRVSHSASTSGKGNAA